MEGVIVYGENAHARRMMASYLKNFFHGTPYPILQCSSTNLGTVYPTVDAPYAFVQREEMRAFSRQMAKLRKVGCHGTKEVIPFVYRKNDAYQAILIFGAHAHAVVEPLAGRKRTPLTDGLDILSL